MGVYVFDYGPVCVNRYMAVFICYSVCASVCSRGIIQIISLLPSPVNREFAMCVYCGCSTATVCELRVIMYVCVLGTRLFEEGGGGVRTEKKKRSNEVGVLVCNAAGGVVML